MPQLGQPIPLRDFAPDAEPLTPGILRDCNNFVGTMKGLRPLPSLISASEALAAACVGAISALMTNDLPVVYAGTSTRLYRLETGKWVECGGVYDSPRRWRFCTFGNHVIAVNGVDAPQYSDMGGDFTDLPDTPPVAAICAASNLGVFLIPPNSDQWHSSLSDSVWTSGGVATQTVTARLQGSPGPITAAHPLSNGGMVLYKERSVYLGNYTGPPFFWDFGPGPISRIAGCASHEAVINLGDVQLFVGPDDFYQFDGAYIARIPNRLREWFFERVDRSRLKDIVGRYDSLKDIAFWHYPSTSAAAGVLDEWLSYSLQTGKWTRGSLNIEYAMSPDLKLQSRSLTYRLLQGDVAGGITGLVTKGSDLPAAPYSSIVFRGVLEAVGSVFETDHKLYTYSGSSAGGYITTQIADPDWFIELLQVCPLFAAWPTNNAGTLRQSAYQSSPGKLPAPAAGALPLIDGSIDAVSLQADGGFYPQQVAREHLPRQEYTADCEITAVAYDFVRAGRI